MGSNEEDPTTTQAKLDSSPLLSHPHPDSSHYLQITYNQGPRPFKDMPFLFVFLLFLSSSSSSCVSNSSSSLSLLSSSAFLRALILVLLLTAILSLPISFSLLLLLLLLRRYAKQLVYISLPFFLLLPIFFNAYWFVACSVSYSCSDAFPLGYRIQVLVFVFLIIGVVVWILVVNWRRVELTIRIIGVASDALSRNLGLFGVLPFMSLGLVIYYVPIVLFLVYARQNGSILPKESDG